MSHDDQSECPTADGVAEQPRVLDVKKSCCYVGRIGEAPAFMQDNQYILDGYRINFDSPLKVLRSIFLCHNELVNIWTHLLGIFFAIFLIFYVSLHYGPHTASVYPQHSPLDPLHPHDHLNQILNIIPHMLNDLDKDIEAHHDILRQHHGTKLANGRRMDRILEEFERLSNPSSEFTPQDLHLISQKLSASHKSIENHGSQTSKSILLQLKQSLSKVKDTLIEKIDSPEFDWVMMTNKNMVNSIPRNVNDPHHVSRWPIFFFLASAIACLACSTFFHTFCDLNLPTNRFVSRLDQAGIAFLIAGSAYPPYYYGYYCDETQLVLYLSVTGASSLILFILSLFDFIHSENWRATKGFIYGGVGVFSAVGFVQLVVKFLNEPPGGGDAIPIFESLPYYLLMGASYLGGLAIYTLRFPERYLPGKFDFCGHSHNIWHCFVVLGIWFSYIGSIMNYEQRRATHCLIS